MKTRTYYTPYTEVYSNKTIETIEVLPSTRLEELARMNFNSDFADLNINKKTIVRNWFMYELIMSKKPVKIIKTF